RAARGSLDRPRQGRHRESPRRGGPPRGGTLMNPPFPQHETTWPSWCERRRRECSCYGSPRSPHRLLRLAATICRRDFPDLVRGDGWERFAYEVLDRTLRSFDPAKGRQDVP